MKEVIFKCRECGNRILTLDSTKSDNTLCIACRRKHGFLNKESEHLQKELERLLEGKELNRNDKKGLLLELAVSMTLDELGIPHEHNPFDITYPCYQENNPDIVIGKLNVVIECKNLNRLQTEHLTHGWLDANIIRRPKVSSFEEKIVVFSHEPRLTVIEYLRGKGWRTYAVESQILTQSQAYNAIPRLKQQLYWLREKMKAREELSSYTRT